MFFYARIRKKGTAKQLALREDGKILVFKSHDTAVKHAEAVKDSVYSIVTLAQHPSHKQSSLFGIKFKKVGW